MPFQICKNFCKILNNLIFKLKMCKFPLTGCLQKICNFFRKTCAIRFLKSQAFQKAKFYQNLTSKSGSKQRFSLLQEKSSFSGSVPDDSCSQYKSLVLGLKGGLWVFRKSQKMSTASDQYFLSYVRNRVKGTVSNISSDPPCEETTMPDLQRCP